MQLRHHDETMVLATDGPLLMAVWWASPSVAQMQRVERLAQAHKEECAHATAFVQFVLDGSPKMPAEARQIAMRLTHDHFELAIAHCVEVGGLKGAAGRALLGGLVMAQRVSKPVQVFSTPQNAAQWLTSHLGDNAWTTHRILSLRQSMLAEHEGVHS